MDFLFKIIGFAFGIAILLGLGLVFVTVFKYGILDPVKNIFLTLTGQKK